MEENIYTVDLDEWVDEDLISPDEAGFMLGYVGA